jgi:hypothetical protein
VRRPPARIVQAYFAVAHVALLAALALVVREPTLATDFYYQPRTIAVVHLITLGWLTGSILGSIYAIAPLAWRFELPAGRIDWVAFWVWAISASGMVTHFWINEYNGMTWAAGTILAAVGVVAWRLLPRLVAARIPGEHRLPVVLAFCNLAVAGTLGVLLGLQKMALVALPGPPLSGVYAHAHLAALGWALMMVFGAGYRLLPMFLPAPMPTGPVAWTPPVLLEAGVLSLGVGLLLSRGVLIVAGAALAVHAVLVFLGQVAAMIRKRLRSPVAMPGIDLTLPVTGSALAYLIGAAGVGVALLGTTDVELGMRLAALYGTLGLIGFLAQLVVGIGGRLLPLTFWMQEYVEADYRPPLVPLHELALRPLQAAVLIGWALGVPVLAVAVFLGRPDWARAGATLLMLGAVSDATNRVAMLRRARRPESLESAASGESEA